MNTWLELLLALLASGGLLALGWLCFGRIIAPVGGGQPVFAVLPTRGDGARLEYALAGLGWLQRGGLARFTVVVADGGLDPQGQEIAAALALREGILLCALEDLPGCITAWSESGGEASPPH